MITVGIGLVIEALFVIILGDKNKNATRTITEPVHMIPYAKPEPTSLERISNVEQKDIDLEIENDRKSLGRCPHNVREHLRTLPKGYKASFTKIKEAKEHGFDLSNSQKWVDAYTTGESLL